MMIGGREKGLYTALTASVLFHMVLVAMIVFVRPPQAAPLAVRYRIEMHAAPAGPRQEGMITKQAVEQPATTSSSSQRLENQEMRPTPPVKKAAPQKQPVRTTSSLEQPTKAKAAPADVKANTSTKAADVVQKAGAGQTGGQGTDLVEKLFHGIDFVSPEYLRNIVNKIARHFEPPSGSNFVADFSFDIDREGCVRNLRTVKSSGWRPFDTEARGAIEKASRQCGFGPLPSAWRDDILSIVFTFDPEWMR